jgi:hypothetical protein
MYLGRVLQDVDSVALSIVNATILGSWFLGGHLLDPGYVYRSLIVIDTAIFVRTFGEGSGLFLVMNTYLGPMPFITLD